MRHLTLNARPREPNATRLERTAGRSGLRTIDEWFLTLLLWLVLGAIVPLLSVDGLFAGNVSNSQWLALLVCAWSGLRLANLVVVGSAAWLSATFWVFVYVWFGLAPSLQLGANRFFFVERFLSTTFTERERVGGLLVILIGLAGYEIGQFLMGDRRSDHPPKTRLSIPRLRIFTVLALAVTAVAIASIGPLALFENRSAVNSALGLGDGATESNVGSAFISTLLRLPIAVSAFLWVLHSSQPSGTGDGRSVWSRLPLRDRSLLLASVATALVVTNPISTPRFLSGAVISALAFAWVTGRNRRSRRLVLSVFIIGSIIVLPNADRFRGSESSAAPLRGFKDAMLEKADYTMYSQVITSMQYVEQFGREPRQLTGPLFFYVPRSIWSAKPIDTGDLIHDGVGYPERLNQSSPLWAELYLAGGLALVLLGFVAYGALSRFAEGTFLASGAAGGGFVGSVIPLVAAYQVFFLRGSMLGATPRLVTLLALAGLVFVGRRSLFVPESDRSRLAEVTRSSDPGRTGPEVRSQGGLSPSPAPPSDRADDLSHDMRPDRQPKQPGRH